MATLPLAESLNEGGKSDLPNFIDSLLAAAGGMANEQGKKVEISSENERRWLIPSGVRTYQILDMFRKAEYVLKRKSGIVQFYVDLETTLSLGDSIKPISHVRFRREQEYEGKTITGSVLCEVSCKITNFSGRFEHSLIINESQFNEVYSNQRDDITKTRYEFVKDGQRIIVDILEHPLQIGFIEIEAQTPEELQNLIVPNIILQIMNLRPDNKFSGEVTGISPLGNRSIARLSRLKRGRVWPSQAKLMQILRAEVGAKVGIYSEIQSALRSITEAILLKAEKTDLMIEV